jgi:hypothetical protein
MYDWLMHDLPELVSRQGNTSERDRWSDFISFVSVTFLIGGIFMFTEIRWDVAPVSTGLARVVIGLLLVMAGFFLSIAWKNVISKYPSLTLSNLPLHSRLGVHTGLVYRTAFILLLALMIFLRNDWIMLVASTVGP